MAPRVPSNRGARYSTAVRQTSIDVRRLKEQALAFFKKGKFAKSAETWAAICEADPKDNQSQLRRGDALAKAGLTPQAWEAYRAAADGFARQGFLPQAVAAAKLALNLKPNDESVPRLLAEFHAERFGVRPPAPAEDVEHQADDAVVAALLAPTAPRPPAAAAQQPPPPIVDPPAWLVEPPPEVPVEVVPPEPEREAGLSTVMGDAALMEELRARTHGEVTVVARVPLPEDPRPAAPPVGAELIDWEVRQVPLFAELTPAAFTSLLGTATMSQLSAGDVVLEQGAPGDSVFAVLTGRVRVFRDEPAGRRELAILEPGAVFGELAVLTGNTRSAWVVAEVDDTTVLEVTRASLERLAAADPSAAQSLVRIAWRRLLSNVMATEPLFAGLKRNERLELAERFEFIELPAGAGVFGEGSVLNGLSVLTSGGVELTSDAGVVPVGSGVLLGDLELLTGQFSSAAVTTTACQLLYLPVEHARGLFHHPSVTSRSEALVEWACARYANPR